jgi:hypothetical protein
VATFLWVLPDYLVAIPAPAAVTVKSTATATATAAAAAESTAAAAAESSAAPAATVFSGTGFVDGKLTPIDFATVKIGDRRVGGFA